MPVVVLLMFTEHVAHTRRQKLTRVFIATEIA